MPTGFPDHPILPYLILIRRPRVTVSDERGLRISASTESADAFHGDVLAVVQNPQFSPTVRPIVAQILEIPTTGILDIVEDHEHTHDLGSLRVSRPSIGPAKVGLGGCGPNSPAPNFCKFLKIKLENFVDFEKRCKMRIWMPNFVSIQTRTNLKKSDVSWPIAQ